MDRLKSLVLRLSAKLYFNTNRDLKNNLKLPQAMNQHAITTGYITTGSTSNY